MLKRVKRAYSWRLKTLNEDEMKKYVSSLKESLGDKRLCTHCFLESHIRAYLEVMADEPDQYIKMSTIYNNLKMMLDDNDKDRPEWDWLNDESQAEGDGSD